VPSQNDIDFLKILSGENILVKSPYYEKGQKGKQKEYPLFSPTTQPHLRNNSFPLPIPFNKTPLFFKFTKTQHLKKKPLKDEFKKKKKNPYAFLTQLFLMKMTPKLIHLAYL
jgi:hypothetical protein